MGLELSGKSGFEGFLWEGVWGRFGFGGLFGLGFCCSGKMAVPQPFVSAVLLLPSLHIQVADSALSG